jgi:outer membrane protein OmpA-like peptidoglycan-associated protein
MFMAIFKHFSRLAVSLAVASAWANPCSAQSAHGANEIIRSLAPAAGQTISPGYRSGGETLQVAGAVIVVDPTRAFSMEVYFEPRSARISARAKAQLANLGRALASAQLAPFRYLIAGHTDAIGADAYNVELSRRRALAVRNYLISAHPIDPRRLIVVGFGAHRLKRPGFPDAAINRRVEVLAIVL